MTPRINVVQGIEDNFEAGKPIDIELRIFDVGMISFELDVRVELGGALLCDLSTIGWL